MNFGVSLSISVKNLVEVLIVIAFNLRVNWGRIAKWTTRSLLDLEHEMSHRLFRSSAVFPVYKSYPSLVKFISKYFLMKDAIVNGHLLMVYCHHLWLLPPSLSVFFQMASF